MKTIINIIPNRLFAGISFLALLLLAVVGCNKSTSTSDSQAMVVTGHIDQLTRVTESAFEAGDQVSLFAVKYTGATPNTISNEASTYVNNQLCIFDGGYFEAYKDDAPAVLYYPSDGSNTDVYALYPYTKIIPDYTAMAVSVPSLQTANNWYAFDYMMAKCTDMEPSPVPCDLSFNHVLAKVELSVKLEGFSVGTAIQSMFMQNFVLDATLDITSFQGTSLLTTIGSTKASSITPRLLDSPKTGYTATYELMLPEQTVITGNQIAEFVIDNYNQDVYKLVLEKDFKLEPGKNNVLNVTLNAGSSSGVVVDHAITEWGETAYDLDPPTRAPEFKFVVVFENTTSNTSVRYTSAIKAGVNENRTFEMNNVLYSDSYQISETETAPAVAFEFYTDGNCPSDLPFNLTSLKLFYDNGNLIQTATVDSDSPIQITEASSEAHILYLDLATGVLRATK